MDILDRADQQIDRAFDALDGKNPDHDTIKERIAGALAAAQVTRARVARDNFRKRFSPMETKKLI